MQSNTESYIDFFSQFANILVYSEFTDIDVDFLRKIEAEK